MIYFETIMETVMNFSSAKLKSIFLVCDRDSCNDLNFEKFETSEIFVALLNSDK